MYDLYAGGVTVLFYGAGSPLVRPSTLVPALISAAIAICASHIESFNSWLQTHIASSRVYFGAFSFLVSFVVVYRSQLAVKRFQIAQRNYGLMASRLTQLAIAIKCFCRLTNDDGEFCKTRIGRRQTMFRWIRLYHKVSIGRFLGKPLEDFITCGDDNLCTDDEYDILLYTRYRSDMVMSWIEQVVTIYPDMFPAPPPMVARIFALADETNKYFHICANIAESPFPYPYLVITVLVVHFWLFATPLIIGGFLPNAAEMSGIFAFMSTWVLCSINVAASMLENPFDGHHNHLPLRYLEHVFATDMDALEYSNEPKSIRHEAGAGVNKSGQTTILADSHEASSESISSPRPGDERKDFSPKHSNRSSTSSNARLPMGGSDSLEVSSLQDKNDTYTLRLADPCDEKIDKKPSSHSLDGTSQQQMLNRLTTGSLMDGVIAKEVETEEKEVVISLQGESELEIPDQQSTKDKKRTKDEAALKRDLIRGRNNEDFKPLWPYTHQNNRPNMYSNYSRFATENLPCDHQPRWYKWLVSLGIYIRPRLTTRDILQDPRGNPVYIRRDTLHHVVHIA